MDKIVALIIRFAILLNQIMSNVMGDDGEVQKTLLPIEQLFPNVSFIEPGVIKVWKDKIHGIDGLVINPYPEQEYLRNHFDSRNGTAIKYLIMHYTYSNFTDTLYLFTRVNNVNPVSAHYAITEKWDNVLPGILINAVPDQLRTWHAGLSAWLNDTSLNKASIGIEHINCGFESDNPRVWCAFDSDQIITSGILSKDIVKQYDIKPNHVLGHNDIAPTRKEDPGPLFPWAMFYHTYGVGAWLDNQEIENKTYIIEKYNPIDKLPDHIDYLFFFKMLKKYGYALPTSISFDKIKTSEEWKHAISESEPVIKAFKAHFSANQRPELYNNDITETDMYWIWALVAKYIPK